MQEWSFGVLRMNRKRSASEASSAAKAEFVRAFYDAADRLVEAQENGQGRFDLEASALRKLEDVIERAKETDSDEFTVALQFASDEYFSRITHARNEND